MGEMGRKAWIGGVVAALVILTLTGAAPAIDYVWLGFDGEWDNPCRWNPYGIPTSSDNASIIGGADVFIRAGVSAEAHDLRICNDQHSTVVFGNQGNLTVASLFVTTGFKNEWDPSVGGYFYNYGLVRTDIAHVGLIAVDSWGLVANWGSFEVEQLYVGEAGGNGNFTLKTGGRLTAFTVDVGRSGKGLFYQSGGTHRVDHQITVGLYSFPDISRYTLDDGLLESIFTKVAAAGGQGEFIQNGGTHLAGSLIVAEAGTGSYVLNDGLLHTGVTAIGEMISGYNASGKFIQYGGTHRVDSLCLGTYANNYGWYEMWGGELRAGSVTVGNEAQYAEFQQIHGTLTVDNLTLAEKLTGFPALYHFWGDEIKSTNVTVGNEGCGVFEHHSGLHTVKNNLVVGNTLSFPHSEYNLHSGSLETQNTIVGGGGGGGEFHQWGGTHRLTTLTLGQGPSSYGAYYMHGGSLEAASVVAGSGGGGEFVMHDGSITTFDLTVGFEPASSGSFHQEGGTVTIWSGLGLVLGLKPGSEGSYRMSDSASLETPALTVGLEGTGRFTMTGGAIDSEYVEVGVFGDGEFEQSGGRQTISGTLALALYPGSRGNYHLSGTGELTVGSLVVKPGGNFRQSGGTSNIPRLENAAVVDLSGGTTTILGKVTNKAGARFSAANAAAFNSLDNQAGAEFSLSHNPAPVNFSGPVTNAGRMEVTETTVIFAKVFSNLGAYISDPSTSRFQEDVQVSAGGYLVGGPEDRFEIAGDFFNTSTRNTDWHTEHADLIFINDKDHKFQLPGLDRGGQNSEGYLDNFAWGLLDLTGETLFLQDDGTPGGALYLKQILGLEFDDPLNPKTILNIYSINGLNLYYDPRFNPDLLGLTLALQGGGFLSAASSPAPLPGALWLVLTGLAGLATRRRRLQKIFQL